MLQMTTEIHGAGTRRPQCHVTADAAASQRPFTRRPAVRKYGIDRKNGGNSPCNGLCRSGINEDRLTCEFSFVDAELEPCIGKGGASFFRQSPQQDSSSYGRHNDLVSILLTLDSCEGRRQSRVLKVTTFPGRRPGEGESLFCRVVRRGRRGRGGASDPCRTARVLCVGDVGLRT